MGKKKFKKNQSSTLEDRKKRLKEAARERAKENAKEKKATASYDVDQLLDKAEECIDRFEYEVAQKFCQRALEMEPDNVRALETAGAMLLELGNTDAAKQCFGRAVEVSPEVGYAKYMSLGQLFEGAEAVQCYQKGIELMMKEREKKQAEELAAACGGPDESEISDHDISSAYCAIAEIYLTDLCFSDEAEQKCEEFINKAVEADAKSAEALQLKASFLLSKDRKDEAREEIKKSVSMWLPKLQSQDAEDKKSCTEEEFDPIQVVPLTFEDRLTAAKVLIEVTEHEMAAEVLEHLLDEDDEAPPVWYMLGWAHYLQGQDYKDNARYYLNEAKKVMTKVKYKDEEMLKHIEELLEELGPGEPDDADMDGKEDRDGGDGLEIESSDEEEMEH